MSTKIIQRKARHRKIETTLRYDHVSDDMVREYFAQLLHNENIIEEPERQENGLGYL